MSDERRKSAACIRVDTADCRRNDAALQPHPTTRAGTFRLRLPVLATGKG